jgi:hypothetical protein
MAGTAPVESKPSRVKIAAFRALIETTQTILTLSSGSFAAVVAFTAQTKVETNWELLSYAFTMTLLAICMVTCLIVLLRGINVLYDENPDINSLEFRGAYAIILLTFVVGLAAGTFSVLWFQNPTGLTT